MGQNRQSLRQGKDDPFGDGEPQHSLQETAQGILMGSSVASVSGGDSRSTTPPSMGAGSARRRSRWGYFRGSAWDGIAQGISNRYGIVGRRGSGE